MAYYGAYELIGKLSSLEDKIEEKRDDIVLNYIKRNCYSLESLDELIRFIAEVKVINLVKKDPTLISTVMDNKDYLNPCTYTIIGENVYRSLFGSLNTTNNIPHNNITQSNNLNQNSF